MDNLPLYDTASARPVAIKHQYTYTSQSKMSLVAYVKAGEGTTEILNVDYMGAGMLR